MSRSKPSDQSPGVPEWASILGGRLRELRAQRAASLSTVATATGISPSFLSLLEQGRTDVSLGRLLPLLEYYDLELTEILAASSNERREVVRHADRSVLFSPAEGIEVYLAAPDRRRSFVPMVVEYSRGSLMQAWSAHDGEEYVFVLEGSLIIEFADAEPVALDPGDSIFFSASRSHRMRPVEGDSARTLMVTDGQPHH